MSKVAKSKNSGTSVGAQKMGHIGENSTNSGLKKIEFTLSLI